ncbi:hypothetical protein LI90_3114 [Carbonactinospora thermoautotrophica]|uniref:Uncharacterized protein n=1 Tax=Carbonactinospora thermoautotrophica TaxID=1469144 RepID=A0A132MVZ7_9ACTN|nr:DUF6519 domain-containing protein [Carbonactinospora thermoautotrophica]KWX02075.1 hypothetical protein LI90_3114 [Carbonactinospora thermoautotrophica]
MHGDFSRLTFRPDKRYSAVLAQQGRVQLDADANEQVAIQLYRQRRFTVDLIGPHAGPVDEAGFRIGYRVAPHEPDDLTIGGGRYYVAGILCEATRPAPGEYVSERPQAADSADQAPQGWTYWDQPDAYRDPERPADHLPELPFLVYLKVWERLVTAVEDPEIRETALGDAMPDTAARARVTWQVLPLPASDLGLPQGGSPDQARAKFAEWVAGQEPTGRLAARTARPPRVEDDPCIIHPESRYRGPENQLYRVEIHAGGPGEQATFKWSRENGSVVFPVTSLAEAWATLAAFGRDDKLDLNVGDWVEVVDDAYAVRGEPAPLLQVEEVDLPGRRVRLSGVPVAGVARDARRHPYLRRWDHRAPTGAPKPRGGALPVQEGVWLDLEDGVQVWFKPGGRYRPGDYWVIPARTIRGTVEWPVNEAGEPMLREADGVRYHYAPLAWVYSQGENEIQVDDLRYVFQAQSAPVPVAQET